MKQEALSYFPDIYLTITAMIIFIAVFSLITWKVMRRSRKSYYDTMAQLPLTKEGINE